MKRLKKTLRACLLPLLITATASANANDHWHSVEVKAVPVSDGIYMLMGEGGNIGVSIGEDLSLIHISEPTRPY